MEIKLIGSTTQIRKMCKLLYWGVDLGWSHPVYDLITLALIEEWPSRILGIKLKLEE